MTKLHSCDETGGGWLHVALEVSYHRPDTGSLQEQLSGQTWKRSCQTWHFWIASLIFSTFTSLNPLILRSVLRVAAWTDYGNTAHQVDQSQSLGGKLERRRVQYSDGVEAIGFELGYICGSDACDLSARGMRVLLG